MAAEPALYDASGGDKLRWVLDRLKRRFPKLDEGLLSAQYFHVPQASERLIFIGARADLGLAPSHPKAQSRIFTAREAWAGLPLERMVEEMDHVWVDEVARRTKWIGRAARLKPGEKIVPDQASPIRCHWNRPTPTIQKGGLDGAPPYVRQALIHPTQPRTLSIREMARAHSFPDAFRFVDALHNGQQRIGNSVPPLMMRAVAAHLRREILDKAHAAGDVIARE